MPEQCLDTKDAVVEGSNTFFHLVCFNVHLYLMSNFNGGAGAADGLCERALDSGVEQRLQIRD